MKRIILYIFLPLLVFAVSSCQQDEETSGSASTGYLQFKVEKNTSTIVIPTRATELPIALQIVNKETGAVVKETEDWTNWGVEPLELPIGNYIVKAFSKDVNASEAGFDEPYYAGQKEVTVTAKVNQSVNIECRLANVKVSVFYSDDVKRYFTELNCTVSNVSGALTFGKAETRSGYFLADDLNISLALTNTDGKQFTFNSEPVTDVQPRNHYRIQYTMKTSGSGDISITLDPTTKEYDVVIGIPKDVGVAVNTWSTFATVSFKVDEGTTTSVCQYRLSGTEEWTPVAEDQTTVENGELITKIEGLVPNTAYDFCYLIDGVISGTSTVVTEEERQLHNGNFDNWEKNNKTWFPGTKAEADAKNSFWDSGNVGAATMSKNPTSPETTDVHTAGGTSAKLSSQFVGVWAIGKFAAGNVYTGRYMQTYTSPMGARIRFGREFSSRPIQMKGWYKYSRGTKIDYGDHEKTELEQSGGDKCAIYIALTDNEGLVDSDGVKTAYEVDNNNANSSTRYTIDLSENNKDVIAYGSITEEESLGASEWTQFTIDLKYRSLTRKPKFIIVVASASKYGDFFTGSSKSVMTLDDFELVYGSPVTN